MRAVVTPRIITYSREEQARVAAELRACLPECEGIARFLGDYGNLRKAVWRGTLAP